MNKQEVEQRYQELCKEPSDIWEHLPILRQHADHCESVCEMGVRSCVSLYAFLSSNAKSVLAIDILDVQVPDVKKLKFICADNLTIEIPKVDMLHIDTRHCYEQMIQELNLHAKNVNKFIACHDCEIFGTHGDDGGKGIMFAINEFIENNKEDWRIVYKVANNNGMLIMARMNKDNKPSKEVITNEECFDIINRMR